VDKALIHNMPKDTIDRAIKRGLGGLDGATLEETTYEGYAPGGVAVYVMCTTDNRNRTVGEVRYAFTKTGGNLGTDGSVAYLFKKQGILTFEPGSDEDKIMEIALESGAEDVQTHEDQSIDVIVDPDHYETVKQAMENARFVPAHAEITMTASIKVPIQDKDTAEKLMRLVDMLEDLDDVQNVYTNADISEKTLAELNG
jgi:YebC/PmpR family DNA-binding regulatory protein